MALQQLVEQTVTGLGYELVEIDRLAAGLLRITIDLPWSPEPQANLAGGRAITLDDCEKVTRQLQYALEVEDIEYRRLGVSSPGIDRLLRDARDFERFVGFVVDVTLKQALGAAAQGQVPANRKKFRGRLERILAADGSVAGWRLVWTDAPPVKPGQRVSKHRAPAPQRSLDFALDEVREARLAPVVDFKGRSLVADAVGG